MDRRDLSVALLAAAAAGCSGGGRTLAPEAEAGTATLFPITAAETAAQIPATAIDTSIPPYRTDRYGFSNAPGSTGEANAVALRYAVAAATAANARLKIPSSVAATPGVPVSQPCATPYPYIATSVLEITCDVEGDGPEATAIHCSGAAGTGTQRVPYFRLTQNREIRDLEIANAGALTDATIGLQLANSSQLEIQPGPLYSKGYMRLARLRIKKFAVNIQVERSFLLTFDQLQSTEGGYGLYCAPNVTAPGDSASAFITTHVHLNCFYADNIVNLYYQTPIASYNVTFINGASQNATSPYADGGASYSNYFQDVSNLHFIDWYTENQPAAIVVTGGGTVTFDALWLGVTGGVYLGPGVWARFINVRSASPAGSSADSLTVAAGGKQYVTIEGCIWPNATPAADIQHCSIRQSLINGVYTAFSAT